MENNENVNIPKNYGLLMLNILTVCSKRGAFLPEEFKTIGELFELLKKELKLDELQQEKQEEKQEDK